MSVNCKEIGRIVCEYHFPEVSPADFWGRSSRASVAQARHIAFLLCRELTSASTTRVGNVFGRTHGAVIRGIQRLKEQESTSEELTEFIRRIRCEINRRNDIAQMKKCEHEIIEERVAA